MKTKSLVLLAFAGVCGLIAMVAIRKTLLNKDNSGVPMVPVLVAVDDLPPGTRLDETNSEFKPVPEEEVLEGAITDRLAYEERALKVRAMPGDWITMNKLTDKGDWGIGGQVPPGMRVLTVPVSATTSHSGLLSPGNRVDVMLTYSARSNMGSVQRTRTILQYIQIFAVGKQLDGGNTDINDQNVRNVSVIVTPEQGQVLLLAQKKGDIHLALRSTADKEEIDTRVVDDSDIDGPRAFEFGQDRSQDQLKDLFDRESRAQERAVENGDPVEELLASETSDDPPTNTTTMTEPVVVDVDPEPEPETWDITIYERGESRVQSIEIEQTEEKVAPATEKSDKKPFWRGLIGTYLKGA